MNSTTRALSLSLAASAAFIAIPANAQEVYVQGAIGQTENTHTFSRDLGANPPMLPVQDASGTSTVSDTGTSFQLGAGVRGNVSGPLFIGAEAYYSFENAETHNVNGVMVTDLDLKATYGIKGKLGVDATDNFSVAAHGGITWAKYDVTNGYTFAPPMTQASNTDSGFAYGVSASYRFDNNISLFMDYTKVSQIEFDGIPEVAGGTGRVNPNSISPSTFATGLRYSF